MVFSFQPSETFYEQVIIKVLCSSLGQYAIQFSAFSLLSDTQWQQMRFNEPDCVLSANQSVFSGNDFFATVGGWGVTTHGILNGNTIHYETQAGAGQYEQVQVKALSFANLNHSTHQNRQPLISNAASPN
jgi:hypothetical protein